MEKVHVRCNRVSVNFQRLGIVLHLWRSWRAWSFSLCVKTSTTIVDFGAKLQTKKLREGLSKYLQKDRLDAQISQRRIRAEKNSRGAEPTWWHRYSANRVSSRLYCKRAAFNKIKNNCSEHWGFEKCFMSKGNRHCTFGGS